jgi:hypothetical protein
MINPLSQNNEHKAITAVLAIFAIFLGFIRNTHSYIQCGQNTMFPSVTGIGAKE